MPDPSEPRGKPTPSVSPRPNSKTSQKRASDTRKLQAQLRVHIERQIARFDAALDAEPPPAGFDSGKVLRDLGGLKNLLDDMKGPDRAAKKGEADGATGRPSLSAADVVAMRADIARRYAAFAAAEPDDGVLDPPLSGPSASA